MKTISGAGVVAVAVSTALLLAGCGGSESHPGPPTFARLAGWLEEGECGEAEDKVVHLPVPKSRLATLVPVETRFEEASVAGFTGCAGPNGYISYYRFPSAAARAEAVRGTEGLISNELFCVNGPELIINDLLGHDDTAEFCERLGFGIHQPTRRYSARQELAHHLRTRAGKLVAHETGVPYVNLVCERTADPLSFECQNFVGGETTTIELVKKGKRYLAR